MYSFKNVVRTLVAASCLTSLSASAVPILDQNNPGSHNSHYCRLGVDAYNLCGESFGTMAGNISGAGIFIDPTSDVGRGTVTLTIYDSYLGWEGGLGRIIASGTSGLVDRNSGWVDVFWTPVATTWKNYYLVATSTQYNFWAMYSLGNSYMNGGAVTNGNARDISMDMVFRTYTDVPQSAAVPEPASLALLGLGLIGFAAARRTSARRGHA